MNSSSYLRILFATSMLLVINKAMHTNVYAVETATADVAPSGIAVLPASFTLPSSGARQRIAVVQLQGDLIASSIPTSQVVLTSSQPEIAKIDGHHVIATGNGSAEIIATLSDGRQAMSVVTVSGAEQSQPWSFRNDVQSILARQGCNMGACHGALAGKGGFRLSLRGYDSEADFHSIAREMRGRRIEIADAGKSLLLAKPTGALPHKGGIRLDPESRDYQILAQWIAAGAEPPRETDRKLTHISVLPANAILKPTDQSQILVNAHYDDGRTIDVTHWAKFSATDEAVASVNDEGTVVVRGAGEAAVLVWFGSQVALSRMTVPYPYEVSDDVFQQAPRRNFIDTLNLAQLQTLRLKPSPPADDETFVRRATIDTIGRLPTEDETLAYLNDSSPEKKTRLIDRLLASEEYVDYWTYKWSDLLLVNGTKLRPIAVESFYRWIRRSVQENKPWDQFVQEILTAKGESQTVGATNFYAIHQTPEEMTENASQAFMGLSIGCAKCHNHPLEKWTNDQYYAMANLFSRVRAKGWGGEPRNGDGIRTVYVADEGELIQPKSGKPQAPAPLDAPAIDFDDPRDRRETVATWMTDPTNPYFARSITNRVWANFFGRGLVEMVDDLRLSNPASNEPLLAASAQHLIDNKFDLKQLMRAILESETYGRSSTPLAENKDELKYLSRYYPRRLMAEVLLDSIDQVAGTSSAFNRVAFPGADFQETKFYPNGTRAIELYDSAVDSYFLKTFGRNPREITCECERSSEPSMVQVLHLSNGETINPKLAAEGNAISRLVEAKKSNEEILEQLFVTALSRRPSDDEKAKLIAVMAEYGEDRRTAIEDAYWSVLASTEFTFNH
jgi:hypothetical protein